ncbi:MAG: hypothetical protein AB7G80_02695 [Dongiaceae bacterium]
MLGPIASVAVGAFARAGEKLTDVVRAANVEASQSVSEPDVFQALLAAKEAGVSAQASGQVLKAAGDMTDQLLDIIA